MFKSNYLTYEERIENLNSRNQEAREQLAATQAYGYLVTWSNNFKRLGRLLDQQAGRTPMNDVIEHEIKRGHTDFLAYCIGSCIKECLSAFSSHNSTNISVSLANLLFRLEQELANEIAAYARNFDGNCKTIDDAVAVLVRHGRVDLIISSIDRLKSGLKNI